MDLFVAAEGPVVVPEGVWGLLVQIVIALVGSAGIAGVVKLSVESAGVGKAARRVERLQKALDNPGGAMAKRELERALEIANLRLAARVLTRKGVWYTFFLSAIIIFFAFVVLVTAAQFLRLYFTQAVDVSFVELLGVLAVLVLFAAFIVSAIFVDEKNAEQQYVIAVLAGDSVAKRTQLDAKVERSRLARVKKEQRSSVRYGLLRRVLKRVVRRRTDPQPGDEVPGSESASDGERRDGTV